MRAAIEHMAARLRVRLDRLARNWAARRGTLPVSEPGEWRHRSIPAHRPAYFPRPAAARAVIRRPRYAPQPLTPPEAVAELDVLDYDFHLFHDTDTGQDSLLHRLPDRAYRILRLHPAPRPASMSAYDVAVDDTPAPTLTLEQAIERLNVSGTRFVFFADPVSGRSNVVYRRYDGHYGLITLEQEFGP